MFVFVFVFAHLFYCLYLFIIYISIVCPYVICPCISICIIYLLDFMPSFCRITKGSQPGTESGGDEKKIESSFWHFLRVFLLVQRCSSCHKLPYTVILITYNIIIYGMAFGMNAFDVRDSFHCHSVPTIVIALAGVSRGSVNGQADVRWMFSVSSSVCIAILPQQKDVCFFFFFLCVFSGLLSVFNP